MTDFEITRLCLNAIADDFESMGSRADGTLCLFGNVYDPLHDDAQALALMNKFHLHVWWWLGDWTASMSARKDVGIAVSPNCNRAICECVAKMQAAQTQARCAG